MEKEMPKESVRKTWIIIIACIGFVLLQGLFVFFVVGDMGQPGWDYRPVKDVPGQSPYAIYEKLPNGQHVRGAEGE